MLKNVSLLLVVLATLSNGRADEPLTLQRAADLALSGNHQFRAANAVRDEAHARASEARSMWLPMISVSETRAEGNNPVFVFGSLLEQGRFGPANFDPAFLNDPPALTNFRTAVSVRWAVFDQLRRFSSIQQATLGVRAGDLARESARQETLANVIRTYYGVALADRKSAVSRDAARLAAAERDSILARRDSGLVVESDLLAAEVQVADLRQQEIEAAGEARVARARLNAALGRPLDDEIVLASNLDSRAFDTRKISDWLAVADRQPNVAQAELGARIAGLETRKAAGAFLPRVDAFGNWGSSGETMTRQNPDRVWGAMVSLDILNPGRLARAAQARSQQVRAEEALAQARSDVAVGIRAAYERVESARQRLDVGSRSVAQATEVVRIVHERYEQGLTTVTELLRAQTALLGASLNEVAARYDYYVSYAELLRVAGVLDTVEAFSS